MPESNSSRAARILQKLSLVRERGLSCFGSEKHQFRLEPPISEAELSAFEKSQDVLLPADYRTFLREAGNGGAGPYYGIFSLNRWGFFAESIVDTIPDNFLALACPLRPNMENTENWSGQFKDCISPYQGTISIGDQGCTHATQLIVSGPCAGRVVYVDSAAAPPYMVHEPDFLGWYERWLDELLQGYAIHWFGYGPRGGEEGYWQALDAPLASDAFKAEAAVSFCRLPGISEDTARRIPGLLDSPIAGVREGALAAIGKFKLQGAVARAVQLLDDPSPGVRKQAIHIAMDMDCQNQVAPVLRRLHEEPDARVANTAFSCLKLAGALSRPELLRIIKESPLDRLRYAVLTEIAWTDEDLPLLLRLASDRDVQIRLIAKNKLRQLIAGRKLLPDLLDLLEHEKDASVVDGVLKMLTELADPLTVPVLLKWAAAEDDLHRLHAIEALSRIGDEQALPVIRAALQDNRQPRRSRPAGYAGSSNSYTFSELVRIRLKESRNPEFRKL